MVINNIKKLKFENNRQYTCRVIKDNIMSLNLKPGEKISEIDLAKTLNVSRTPIREAISTLKAESLVLVIPQKGSFVSKINLDFVEEAFFMRNILEKEILKLACKKFSNNSILELEKNLYMQEFQAKFEGDQVGFFNLDNAFHQIIYSEVKKKRIWNVIKQMHVHYNRIRLIDTLEKTNLEKTLKQHSEIIDLIKNSNINAIENIVSVHLSNFKSKIPHFRKAYPGFFI